MEVDAKLMYEATMGELHKAIGEMLAYKALSMQLQKENEELKKEIAKVTKEAE